MIFKRRAKAQPGRTAGEHEAPADVNDQSAQASEDAACCLSDIDEVLAEMDALAEETEEDRARREYAELYDGLDRGTIAEDEFERRMRVWRATYGHLHFGCIC